MIVGYTRHHNARFVCELCPAQTGFSSPCSYLDCRSDANYSKAPISTDLYISSTESDKRSPWLTIPDFSIEQQKDCLQHILYASGIGSDISAGTLKSLLLSGVYGDGELPDRITTLHEVYTDSSFNTDGREARQFTIRRLGMTAKNKHPSWQAAYKHGHVKTFLHFAASESARRQRDVLEQLILTCVSSLSGFVKFLEFCAPVLDEWEREHAVVLGQKFLDTYTILLRLDFNRRGSLGYEALFKPRPKLHSLWHHVDCLRSSCINCIVMFSCWQEEDFMGKILRIARRVHMRRFAERCSFRYLLLRHSNMIKSAEL